MKLVPTLTMTWCACAAATAQAQSIQISDAARATYAQAYGYDWEYDDGTEVDHEAPTWAREWTDADGVDLSDWWSFDVGSADFYSETRVGTDRIDGLLDCSASTAGNHFHEDASGRATFDVDFAVPALGVRYAFDGEADSSYGYNMANVRLRHVESSSYVLVLSGDYGDSDSVDDRRGWLPAGTYELRAEAEAMAWGNNDHAETQSSHVEFELRLCQPGDLECDGDVDLDDMHAYKAAWRAGTANADCDGDGVVDDADWQRFDAAWRAGCGKSGD